MMRRLSAIQLSAVFLLIGAIAPAMVAQTQSVHPEKTGQATRQRQGFIDYALGKINPSNTDYGAVMAEGRSDLVGHTIDDLYFWSNAVTLGLLVCAAGIIYFEWHSAAKKEIVAATIIAELWNGRVSDRIEIVRRTEQFNQLAEQHNAEVERALMTKQQSNQAAETETTDLKDTVQALARTASASNGDAAGTSSDAHDSSSADPSLARNRGMSVQQQVQLLKNSLEATRNSERNLRERLNQANTQLDEERKRNRTLKGANG
jgi:hypothetical protein